MVKHIGGGMVVENELKELKICNPLERKGGGCGLWPFEWGYET